MNVKFIDNFETIGEKAWDVLVAKSPTNTIFQTWAWQRAWWLAHACPGRELRLVAVYDGNELRVLMPLFLEARVLRFMGYGAADRIDLIYDAARSADLLALLMPLKARNDWDEIELAPVPDASPTWRYLKIMAEEASLFPVTFPSSVTTTISSSLKRPRHVPRPVKRYVSESIRALILPFNPDAKSLSQSNFPISMISLFICFLFINRSPINMFSECLPKAAQSRECPWRPRAFLQS
jgi:hypothetical protein